MILPSHVFSSTHNSNYKIITAEIKIIHLQLEISEVIIVIQSLFYFHKIDDHLFITLSQLWENEMERSF